VAVAASPALAGGVYLKVSAEGGEARAGQPVRVVVSAVVTRPVTLPAQPDLIPDGALPAQGVQATPVDGAAGIALVPGKGRKAAYDLLFARPGTYKFKLRYRVGGEVVETNKLTVKVGEVEAAAGR
jgi:hypothetical protein